jgi:hypothetical protein
MALSVYAGGLRRSRPPRIPRKDIRQRYEEERGRILRSPDEIKKLMNESISDIKKRNLKYRVEINEQMKYKIAQITGASCPDTIEEEASVQWNYGNEQWRLFMKIYKKGRGKQSYDQIIREEKSAAGRWRPNRKG